MMPAAVREASRSLPDRARLVRRSAQNRGYWRSLVRGGSKDTFRGLNGHQGYWAGRCTRTAWNVCHEHGSRRERA